MNIQLLKEENGYRFWKLTDETIVYWNITPRSQGVPEGGYHSKKYIEKIKGQKF